MDNFLKVLEEAKEAELKELIKTLKKKKEIIIDQLGKEVDSLKTQVANQKESNKNLKIQQKKYQDIKLNDFVVMESKQKIASELFHNIVRKQLNNSKFETEWLKKGINSIKGFDAGEILANDSFEKIADIKTSHKLKKDKNIDQKGFIFVNDNVEVDYLASTFFNNVFENYKSNIFKELFN